MGLRLLGLRLCGLRLLRVSLLRMRLLRLRQSRGLLLLSRGGRGRVGREDCGGEREV